MTVSRETSQLVFGDQLPVMDAYADILATQGVERGLIGPREVDRLWSRHLINCGVVVSRLPHGASVADVGSGAGLPGLVWAIARPDLQVTLIEPLLRRTTFLHDAIASLGLSNVRIVRARAENVDEQFDVVTARAVAALKTLAKWCLPLVRSGGVLLAMKGQTASDEVASAMSSLKRLGASDIVITKYGEELGLETPTTVVEVTK